MSDLYMHTLDGRPAQFEPKNKRICWGMRRVTRLASSLDQIRRERRQSMRFYFEWDASRYGHIRISRDAAVIK